ncbi:uncharacterized protein K02A2.6-like [Ostrea edulis]|uniref:uncharacterized protein K02A2.6-like n=1 Tax=Ostrea edulis TaxID=37623 RepID=UPI0024AED6B7|nr:uncharacterized protein K02A2.6-like [Ostrea edulis]
MLRDHIVFGVKSKKVREKLIEEGSELTLQKCTDIVRTYELSQKQLKTMNFTEEDPHVNMVMKKRQHTPRTYKEKQKKCFRCGYEHSRKDKCPVIGQSCNLCHKSDHFASMCKSKRQQLDRHKKTKERQKQKKINLVQDEYTDEDSTSEESDCGGGSGIFMGVIHDVNSVTPESDWTVKCKVNNKIVIMHVDTRAKCNVVSHSVLQTLKFEKSIQKSSALLKSFSGHTMKSKGRIVIPCTFNKETFNIPFEVVEVKTPTILGSYSSQEIGLVQKMFSVSQSTIDTDENLTEQFIQKNYSDLFLGIGCLPGKHKIHLKENVQSVVHPPRRISVALRQKVKDKLKTMEQEGIIVRQSEPTEWVNSLVTVIKPNGSVRLCLDPKDLNSAIKRPHYPMLTIDEIVSRMPSAKYFSKLDAISGFWQIQLDEESSKLCRFNSPLGRFRFLRMPFGLNCASEIYQSVMSRMVEDIEGAEVIVDDILIWGRTLKEHDQRLKKVLNRTREYNLKLSADKCEFRKQEITHVGHVLSSEGLKADPEKIRAVTEMIPPSNRKELRKFMGFIQYLAKFLPNLSKESAPLRQLLSNEVSWHWDGDKQQSFQKLKEMVTNTPVLTYFDPEKPVLLTVDSSSTGLGAAVIQSDKPVAYGSRALTTTQQKYSQLEKETLAIVYGCQKFHQYVYGRRIQVETDHKPLQSIFRKPLHEIPARLQKMVLTLQCYDLDVTYKPGSTLVVADHLSRNYLNETTEKLVDEFSVNALSYLPITPEKYAELQKVASADLEMMLLRKAILEGWPERRDQLPTEIRTYWNYRDELACIDGLIYKGLRLVIPQACRKEMLERTHESHLGIVKCKAMAREVMFWPSMGSHIEDIISKCSICACQQRENPRENLIPHKIPDRPWSKIAMDLFEFCGNQYLISVDCYSKWPEIAKLEQSTSNCVIQHLRNQFARYGIPDEAMSDNGPQFASAEFRKFTKEYEFRHVTSSPHYPQSNGQVERMVQTIKHLLKKAKDPYLAILDYRNTPLEELGLSPAQLFLAKRLKTKLPVSSTLLKPQNAEFVRESLMTRQAKQKRKFDRHIPASDLKPLVQGENVMIKHNEKWMHGSVVEKHETPRSRDLKSTKSVHEEVTIEEDFDLKPYRSECTVQPKNPDKGKGTHTLKPGSPHREKAKEEDLQPRKSIPTGPSTVESASRCEVMPNSVKTKSGREVKKPSRFRDE